MKLSLFLLTLLMMPIHTEAKPKEGRFLTSIAPFVCKQVQEIGSSVNGQYIQMGNGTDKDMTMVTFSLANRERVQSVLVAAAASLTSEGRVLFCISKKDLDTDSKAISITGDASFSAMSAALVNSR